MTSTNWKCLQKCSLASLGHLAEIKGHVCPSLCLLVGCCFSVQYSAYGLQCPPPSLIPSFVNYWCRGIIYKCPVEPRFKFNQSFNCQFEVSTVVDNPLRRGNIFLFCFLNENRPFYSWYSTMSGDKAVDNGRRACWQMIKKRTLRKENFSKWR